MYATVFLVFEEHLLCVFMTEKTIVGELSNTSELKTAAACP